MDPRYTRSWSLFARAQKLIPGGIHLSGRPLVGDGNSPVYLERGRGGRVWDIDGNEYIDLVMALGPVLLGYAHEEVDAAAAAQARHGNLLTLNHPLHVQFAERLVARFPSAEMATFFKTGSEATTAALRIARRHTRRRIIARCGYHGWHDWCLPGADFVPAGLDSQVLGFDASDPPTLSALLDRHRGEVAAVIVAAEAVIPPDRSIFEQLIEISHRHGAVFVLDEIKTALRIRPGSLQELLGIEPDLTTVSKALGNGWPIAALVGRREVMQSGAGLHVSATFHGETVAMAAALATLDVLDREPVFDHVWRMGERLIDGLNALAARHGLPFEVRGEPLPPMPNLRAKSRDPVAASALAETFFTEVVRGGVLLHPRHLWFVSYAHSADDIERVLSVADQAMATTAARHRDLLERDPPASSSPPPKTVTSRDPAQARRRLALVGCGPRAHLHALALSKVPNVELAGVCDLDAGRREQLAEQLGGVRSYADVGEMLERERPELLDLVTGPGQRAALLRLASERGVPVVIVEKPLALDCAELREIEAVTGASDTTFVVNLQLRFHPRLAALIDDVRNGAIGEVRFIDASARMNVADQGPHLLDLVAAFTNGARPLSVFGQVGAVDLESAHRAPASLIGELVLENRVRVALAFGANAARACDDAREYRHKRIAVYGTRGFVSWQMDSWEKYDAGGYAGGGVNYLEEDVCAQAELVRHALAGDAAHPTALRSVVPQADAIFGLYASALAGTPVALPFEGNDDLLPQLAGSGLLSSLFG